MNTRHANGQLLPVSDRMTADRLAARAEKRDYRAKTAQRAAMTHGMVIGCIAIFRRGIFGRLKWLVFGR